MARQTSTKSAINMIMIHRAQTKAIFESQLSDANKILVLQQLNVSCELLLQRENCYFGYIMPDLTDTTKELIKLNLGDQFRIKPDYYMHHYQARVKVEVKANA